VTDVGPDAVERSELCDLLDELGPDAPTLLVPWTTRDLVAHLVLRERDPLAAPGLVLGGAWGRFAERRRRLRSRTDYAGMVATVRSGPPPGFFRIGWVRRVPNLNELFVHHEDVRRANGRPARPSAPELDAALWHNLGIGTWLLTRQLREAGLDLEWAGTGQVRRVRRARRGTPTVHLVGRPGELMLYLFGRKAVAEVERRGPAGAVEAVERAPFGM